MSTVNTVSIAPSLGFVMLFVADLDQATTYLESLGFRYLPEESSPTFHEFLDGSNKPFGILLSGPNMPKPGTAQFYFTTPDLNALHTQLSSKGTVVTPITEKPFGTVFDVPTLDGHHLTMQQG